MLDASSVGFQVDWHRSRNLAADDLAVKLGSCRYSVPKRGQTRRQPGSRYENGAWNGHWVPPGGTSLVKVTLVDHASGNLVALGEPPLRRAPVDGVGLIATSMFYGATLPSGKNRAGEKAFLSERKAASRALRDSTWDIVLGMFFSIWSCTSPFILSKAATLFKADINP